MQLIASPAFFPRAVTERAVHELEQEQGTDAFAAIQKQKDCRIIHPVAAAFVSG